MRKKQAEKPGNHERWLLTYADLITLLMIFFVVMYALSQIDSDKYKQLSESLKIALGIGQPNNMTDFQGGQISPFADTIPAQSEQKERQEDVQNMVSGGKDPDEEQFRAYVVEQQKLKEKEREKEMMEEYKLEQVKALVDKYLQENKLTPNVSTQLEERGLVLRLSETMLFDSGRAYIKPYFRQKLIELGKILRKIDNYVRVEGHTDNIPIHNNEFNSNWQLSTARATNVTETLITGSGINPARLSAVGYSEFRPVAKNSSEAGRMKNRRVDILIINNRFNTVEASH